MIKKSLIIFVLWKFLLSVFTYLATFILPLKTLYITDLEFAQKFSYFFWIWGNFDGDYYMHIAKSGYDFMFTHPFFPFYPILIRGLHSLLGFPYLISGEFFSNLSFILSLFVIQKLLNIDKKPKLTSLVFFIVFLFPTSLFSAAVYNDAPFLLLASLCIYFARKKSWVLSGIWGALATLTRLNGLALAPFIFFEYLHAKEEKPVVGWNFRKLFKEAKYVLSYANIVRTKIYALLLIPLAFLSYLLYTHIAFGNWYLVFSGMKVWNQDRVTFPLQVFWRYLKIIFTLQASSITYWLAIMELLFVIFYIFMMFYSYKKIRFSYWVFFSLSIFIPSLTGTFQGMPRYGLHLYPLFLSLALFLERRGTLFKLIYFGISATLLFILTALFTRGYFVA